MNTQNENGTAVVPTAPNTGQKTGEVYEHLETNLIPKEPIVKPEDLKDMTFTEIRDLYSDFRRRFVEMQEAIFIEAMAKAAAAIELGDRR